MEGPRRARGPQIWRSHNPLPYLVDVNGWVPLDRDLTAYWLARSQRMEQIAYDYDYQHVVVVQDTPNERYGWRLSAEGLRAYTAGLDRQRRR